MAIKLFSSQKAIKQYKRNFRARREVRLNLIRSVGEREYPHKPGTLKGIDHHHIYRYNWAASRCNGLDVFDYGCGIGYGSYMVSQKAKTVTGFDISKDALKWAAFYAERTSNLSYLNNIPEKDFDCIVCFECIEHVTNPEELLQWIASHTRDLALLSTPIANPGQLTSVFHTQEFTQQEFFDLLLPYFAIDHYELQDLGHCKVALVHCRKK